EKTRELELAQAEIIQAEKLGALGQLSAGIAHEIRNPLNSISLFAQVLKQRMGGDEECGSYSDKIMAEIERIDSLLIKLLSVSEHSLGETAELDLAAVVDGVLADFSRQLTLQ
ncbi:MAG: hybrid sensor histidine kinase/response regulator, partial [Desulfuromonadales bacterium]|nr:hybrid sensor histidine kinase/response regulator [Desulfuromonadales bacterium]NIS39641.1 hybrid sensor histidine kinase/response regulator [Desulfuromonadales bacterium]